MLQTDKSPAASKEFFETNVGLQVDDELLARITTAVSGVKYGQIAIAIHDGRVVQVDRVQQMRLFRNGEQKLKRETNG